MHYCKLNERNYILFIDEKKHLFVGNFLSVVIFMKIKCHVVAKLLRLSILFASDFLFYDYSNTSVLMLIGHRHKNSLGRRSR